MTGDVPGFAGDCVPELAVAGGPPIAGLGPMLFGLELVVLLCC